MSLEDLYQSAGYDDLHQLCLQKLRQDPRDSEAIYYLAMVYFHRQQYFLTSELLNMSLHINRFDFRCYDGLGQLLMRRGLWQEATLAFRQCLRLNSQCHHANIASRDLLWTHPQISVLDEPAPAIDIVVVVHNQLEYVTRCLQSLFAHTSNFHLYLWDNASDQSTQTYLSDVAAKHSNVTLVRSEENLGFIIPNNRLALMGQAPMIILLNSDTEVFPGWAEAMVGFLQLAPNVAEVGFDGARLRPDFAWTGPGYGYDTDFIGGWCAGFFRKTYEHYGLFDETQLKFAYCEDTDFSFRLRDSGKDIYVLRMPLVWHKGYVTSGEVKKLIDMERIMMDNQQVLKQRWAPFLSQRAVTLRQSQSPSVLSELELAGTLYLRAGMLRHAECIWLKVVEKDSARISAYMALGLIYRGLKKHTNATAMYQAVLRLKPGHVEASQQISQIEDLVRREEI